MKKKQKFSLRKLTVGIASVSLGSVVLLSGTQSAQAETNTNDPAVQKQIELARKAAIESAQKEHAQKIADAKAEIYKLENLSNFTKARYSAKITKAATDEIAGLVQTAKAEDAKAAASKNTANEQDSKAVNQQVELAKKVAAEQVAKAQAEVNNLANISKETKAKYNDKIAKAATDDIPALVKDAKAEDSQVATAKKVAAEQAAKQKIATAQKDHAQKIADAQAEVNKLENISNNTKAEYNSKIAKAATDEIAGLVKDAKAVDGQVATAKKVAAEQAAKQKIATAQKAHAQRIANAQAEVNSLKNISKDTKAKYNQQIARAATDEIPALVKEVKALDAAKQPAIAKKEIVAAQKAHADQIKGSQALVNKLENLSKDAKDKYNSRIAKAATDEVEAIVKEAQAENAKQAPAKKEVKPAQKATTTPGQASKAGQNNKAVTAQKDGKTTATTNKAAAQQKAKDAKKQLPATGEQDQVLFGLLSGSLFASAGTLFLLNARRRKENE